MAQKNLVCPEHLKSIIVQDDETGDFICTECGLVLLERFPDPRAEWRSFEDDDGENPSRVGDPEDSLLEGYNMSTVIGIKPLFMSAEDVGLPEYQRNLQNDKNILRTGFQIIALMATRMHMSKVVTERAKSLLKEVTTMLKHMRNTEGKAAACLYIASRQEGIPRTFSEICAVTKCSKTEIMRNYKKIVKLLNIEVNDVSIEHLISRFCQKLELKRKVENVANMVAQTAEEMHIVEGRSPTSIVGASIFMAAEILNDFRTEQSIAKFVGISLKTLQTIYERMVNYGLKTKVLNLLNLTKNSN